jgi:hypothetical protein
LVLVGDVLYCTTGWEAYGSAMYRVIGGANGIPSIFSHDGAFGISLNFAEDLLLCRVSIAQQNVDYFTG